MKRVWRPPRPEVEEDTIERRTKRRLAAQRRRKQYRAALTRARKYRGSPPVDPPGSAGRGSPWPGKEGKS